MGYFIFCSWMVVAIIVGVVILQQNKKRKALEHWNPETKEGLWVGSYKPMAALWYIFSFLAAMVTAIVLGTWEGDYSAGVYIVILIALVMILAPLYAFWNKWTERTILNDQGIQVPRFLFRPVFIPWSDITGIEATRYTSLPTGKTIITHFKIHTVNKVYSPTWDRETWSKHKNKITETILERAHLKEEAPGRWVR